MAIMQTRSPGVRTGGQTWTPKPPVTAMGQSINEFAGDKSRLNEVLALEKNRPQIGGEFFSKYYTSIGRPDLDVPQAPIQPQGVVTNLQTFIPGRVQPGAILPQTPGSGGTPQEVLGRFQQPATPQGQSPGNMGLYQPLTNAFSMQNGAAGAMGPPQTGQQKMQAFSKAALMDQTGGVLGGVETANTWLNTKGPDSWAMTAARTDSKGKVRNDWDRGSMAYYDKKKEEYARNFASEMAQHGTTPFKTVEDYVEFAQSVEGYTPLVKEYAKSLVGKFMPANLRQQQADQEMTAQVQGMKPGEKQVMGGRIIEGPPSTGMDLPTAQEAFNQMPPEVQKDWQLAPVIKPDGSFGGYTMEKKTVRWGEVSKKQNKAEDAAVAESMVAAGIPVFADANGDPIVGPEAKKFFDEDSGEPLPGKRWVPPSQQNQRPQNLTAEMTPEEKKEWQGADSKRKREIRQGATDRWNQGPIRIRPKGGGPEVTIKRSAYSKYSSQYEIVK